MRSAVKFLVVFALLGIMAAPLAAQEATKKKRKQGQQPPAIATLMKKVKEANLSEDQLKQIRQIAGEYAGKLREVQQKQTALVGPEGRKKMAAARKAAAAEGKKGKALQEAVDAALQLSEAQQKERAELRGQNAKLVADMKAAIAKVVGDEQAKELGLVAKRARKKKDS